MRDPVKNDVQADEQTLQLNTILVHNHFQSCYKAPNGGITLICPLIEECGHTTVGKKTCKFF